MGCGGVCLAWGWWWAETLGCSQQWSQIIYSSWAVVAAAGMRTSAQCLAGVDLRFQDYMAGRCVCPGVVVQVLSSVEAVRPFLN
jgi:hypothetical protein